jgi:D-serine deaminase-like pyridoxal phosphate-dependent protein
MHNLENIATPTLILNKDRVVKNIKRMAEKSHKSGVRFRPHFKTHQSAEIGEWFRDFGVHSTTVSSLDMALYFADHGWNDITVAFPVNIREIDKINYLATRIKLNLLIESIEVVRFLANYVTSPIQLWIKIDTGYNRTGVSWNSFEKIHTIADEIMQSPAMTLCGILTHSGHTYEASSKDAIKEIYSDTIFKMKEVKERLLSTGIDGLEISIGDTPSCSVVENLSGADEIRPGNFVFYDVMQLAIGSCTEEEIAVAVACPVVAKHADRGEIVIHGGAIHLSKDFILENDKRIFGKIALPSEAGWGSMIPDCYVSSLSQEHGIVKAGESLFNQTNVGDIVIVVPVHSCLTANLMRVYQTLQNEKIYTIRDSNYHTDSRLEN